MASAKRSSYVSSIKPTSSFSYLPKNLACGEKGTLEYTVAGVGDARVALFFALVRNISDDRVAELMENCIRSAAESELPGMVADLFVLAVETRDCRGGKGERAIFYTMMIRLFQNYPNTVLQLLSLVNEYGSYKDFFKLMELTAELPQYQTLRARITDIIANQLLEDEAILEGRPGTAGSKKNISLCAKYCPREGKHFAVGDNASAFSELVNKLYPVTGPHKTNKKQYRQLIAKLSNALDVPEIKMCGNRFSELEFPKVPSRCTKKYCKAFLNERVHEPPPPEQDETGNRFPSNEDRVLCRQNLRKAVHGHKVKGKEVYPHEVVETIYKGRSRVSTLQLEVLNAQWKDIRANLLAQLAKVAEGGEGGAAVNVGKLVPLSDVSGSMEGIPMLVSIALGILVSEVNHPAFRDRVLTFESEPSWVNLSELTTIAQKVEKLRHAPWGGSTDVNKAFEQIRKVVREHKLREDEIPDLIIFSDMQFDQAVGAAQQQTQLEQIRKMFHDVGMEIAGTPYPAPKIVFWNLRGDTSGFPAKADDENVQMLSGYSPLLLKYVLEGEPLEEAEVVMNVVKAKPTPYESLRRVLDDERYHKVRELLSASEEGHLAQYRFEAPLPPPINTEA